MGWRGTNKCREVLLLCSHKRTYVRNNEHILKTRFTDTRNVSLRLIAGRKTIIKSFIVR